MSLLSSIIAMKALSLKGQIFGELLVLKRVGNDKNGRAQWLCKCLKTKRQGIVKSGALTSGNTTTSKRFPKSGPECFNSLDEYLYQFNWSVASSGYLCSRLVPKGKKEYLHNVVWRWHYGEIPDGYLVDHIDRDITNSRDISNLRLLTPTQNNLNRVIKTTYTSCYKGVSWDKTKRKWCLDIRNTVFNIRVQRYYETEEEAAFGYNIYMMYHAPHELVYEHDIPGNNKDRFIPILNEVK